MNLSLDNIIKDNQPLDQNINNHSNTHTRPLSDTTDTGNAINDTASHLLSGNANINSINDTRPLNGTTRNTNDNMEQIRFR